MINHHFRAVTHRRDRIERASGPVVVTGDLFIQGSTNRESLPMALRTNCTDGATRPFILHSCANLDRLARLPERTTPKKVVNRLHWARTYLKKIGALENSNRGVWSITPTGLDFLAMDQPSADKALKQADNTVRAEMRKAKARDVAENEADDDGETDDWRDTLLTAMKAMDPAAFERLSMRVLREAGFRNVEVLGRSGDGGIDGVGVYKLSLVSFPTYFQSKRYAGSVPASVVRDFRGALSGRGEKGLVISTGNFTPAAKAEATRDGAPPVDLVGGDDLCDLLKEYGLGVHVQERVVEDITVDEGFFDTI